MFPLHVQGATFNPDIVYAVAKATSDEVRAKVSLPYGLTYVGLLLRYNMCILIL